MRDFLVFQLYGPLVSWGGVAVGQIRHTETQPTKSAIIGLISAALGVRRDEEQRLRELADGYGFAVRTELSGVLERDFQTAEVPATTSLKGQPHRTRRDEVQAIRHGDNPVLSFREYRTDSLNFIALWQKENAPYSLDSLADALKYPHFQLYLGRKSCPLALPLKPEKVSANSLREVFSGFENPELHPFLSHLCSEIIAKDRSVFWQWDVDFENSGFAQYLEVVRRDVPLSRKRWQFAERIERQFVETPNNLGKKAVPEKTETSSLTADLPLFAAKNKAGDNE
jgi:CRISPR system Cascade subunit CasD